jgi:transglutaminase-like putative cysteine protease
MKKLFSFHSFITWVLLLITTGALVWGVKEGVRETQNAEFFPIAAFAATAGYVLGFGKWTTRRAWTTIIAAGSMLIFAESARLIEPLKTIIYAIPQFEIDFLHWLFQKENVKALFPDTSVFQTQFALLISRSTIFATQLSSGGIKHAAVREFIWDMPLLLVSAWMGWGISRRDQILLAFMPALTFHAYILYYTSKDMLSLQVNVFALVLLAGIQQKQNLIGKSENAERAARETNSALVVLSIFIAALAGFAPSISIKSAAQELSQKENLATSLGLEREIPRAYVTSGLPRQHLIGLSPALSKRVVFTVQTGELAQTESAIIKEVVPRHYWRWLTYDIYNGQGWTTSPVQNKSYPANQLLARVNLQYQIIHQQVKKSTTEDERLYSTGSLISANEAFDASWRTLPSVNPLLTDMLGATVKSQIYQAESFVPAVSANALRAAPQEYPKEIQHYLQLPKSTPQRVLELAQELTRDLRNPYDKAKSIETYLRTYPYTLHIPPPPSDRDIADYFLFDLKTGYCDYYATSMIVLARATGLPARLVIGYSSGIYDPRKAEYVVREENAHSWVEIYFTGIGWVEFEPTASQPPINFQEKVEQNNSRVEKKAYSGAQLASGYTKIKNFTQNITNLLSLITFTALVTLIGWALYIRGGLRSHKTIHSIYAYVFYHGKKIYKTAPIHETPSAFAEKLKSKLDTGHQWTQPARGEIETLTSLYLKETYSAHPITQDEREAANKIWKKLFWRLVYVRAINFSGSPARAD